MNFLSVLLLSADICSTGDGGFWSVSAALVFLAMYPYVSAKSASPGYAWMVLVCTVLVVIDVYNLQVLLEHSAGLVDNTSIAESVTSAIYWKQRAEKDTGQKTNNPHLLAARILKEGVSITHNEVNTVLDHQNISVTQEELNELKDISFKDYPLTEQGLKDIKSLYPRKSDNKA